MLRLVRPSLRFLGLQLTNRPLSNREKSDALTGSTFLTFPWAAAHQPSAQQMKKNIRK